MAFDDRELEKDADGNFEFTYVAEPGAKTMIVREVFNDWDTEERGTLWIERADTIGQPAKELTRDLLAKKYEVAARSLVGSIQTWFAFPHFFQYKEPVNTLTAPQSTPGGLASQRSSIGHYELRHDQALVVTLPRCDDCAYQGAQIGSDWYASTDYETHQTSLTKAQAVTDPDGKMRFVISEQDPGIANWLETTGHPTGAMMLRWQRLERDLTQDADGPVVEVVPFADVQQHLPALRAHHPRGVRRAHRRPAARRGAPDDQLSEVSPRPRCRRPAGPFDVGARAEQPPSSRSDRDAEVHGIRPDGGGRRDAAEVPDRGDGHPHRRAGGEGGLPRRRRPVRHRGRGELRGARARSPASTALRRGQGGRRRLGDHGVRHLEEAVAGQQEFAELHARHWPEFHIVATMRQVADGPPEAADA